MIVKVTYGSEEQSYFLDDSIDVRHMLIDYVDDFGMLLGYSRKRNSIYKKLEYDIT